MRNQEFRLVQTTAVLDGFGMEIQKIVHCKGSFEKVWCHFIDSFKDQTLAFALEKGYKIERV